MAMCWHAPNLSWSCDWADRVRRMSSEIIEAQEVEIETSDDGPCISHHHLGSWRWRGHFCSVRSWRCREVVSAGGGKPERCSCSRRPTSELCRRRGSGCRFGEASIRWVYSEVPGEWFGGRDGPPRCAAHHDEARIRLLVRIPRVDELMRLVPRQSVRLAERTTGYGA